MTGDFTAEGLTDDVGGLTDDQLAGVATWSTFYAGEPNYRRVGRLAGGRFYDAAGGALPPAGLVRAAASRAAAARAAREAEERAAPSCSAAWTAEGGGRVWCEPGGGRVPRRLAAPQPAPEAPPPAGSAAAPPAAAGGQVRCACVPAGEGMGARYAGCAEEATECATGGATAAAGAAAEME